MPLFPQAHDKLALICQDQAVSYRSLRQAIAGFAAGLPAQPFERIVLFAENRPEWIYTFYAIWSHGAVCVPVDAGASPQDLAAILADCQPQLVVCSQATQRTVSEALTPSAAPEMLAIEELNSRLAVLGSPALPENLIPNYQAAAAILYTSGTTGQPKGVVLSFDNFLANIEAVKQLALITEKDRLLSFLPFHHIFPLQANVVLPLSLGATIILATSLEQQAILGVMQSHHPSVVIGVPRLYQRFRDALMVQIRAHVLTRLLFRLAATVNHLGFSQWLFAKIHKAFGASVRIYVSGGAKLDLAIAKDLWALGFKMLEGYGTTETAPLIAVNPENRIKLGAVGLPVPGCEVKLAAGEIAVRGRNVMQGYFRKPEATEQVLENGWYFTGDLGAFDAEGYLFILGRKDEMIVLPNGENIAPEEIEKRLQEYVQYVKEAAVLLAEDRLTALIYPDPSLGEPEEALAKLKRLVIEPYNQVVPNEKKILAVRLAREPFPRTRLGKLRRFALSRLLQTAAKPQPSAEPQFQEYILLKQFLEHLKSTPAGPNDYWELDLGLDSLDLAELTSFSAASFGVELPGDVLRSHPTVAELAAYLRDRKTRLKPTAMDWKTILAETRTVWSSKPAKIYFRKALKNLISRYFTLERHGLENLPRPPFILAANHQSYLDAPVIAAVLPSEILDRTSMVIKEGIVMARVASLISHGNLIKVNEDKNVVSALRQTAAALRSGRNVMIFPEGQRSPDGQLQPFKKAFAILSKELNVPVLPAAVQGAFELMPRGRFWPRRGKIRVDFLKPVMPGGMSYEALTKKVEVEVHEDAVRPLD